MTLTFGNVNLVILMRIKGKIESKGVYESPLHHPFAWLLPYSYQRLIQKQEAKSKKKEKNVCCDRGNQRQSR